MESRDPITVGGLRDMILVSLKICGWAWYIEVVFQQLHVSGRNNCLACGRVAGPYWCKHCGAT